MVASVIKVDLSEVNQAFAVLGFFCVVYGLVSYTAKERLYLSESLIALLFGIITGPYVLGWVDPLSWSNTETTDYVTYQFTRFVVGVQVLFCGISLPKAYLRREAISLTILLGAVMTLAWVTTAALIYGIIGRLTYLECLALAASITPTDPVLANAITKGRFAEKHVPANVRNLIVAESGANDGLGFPFLYLALYLMQRTSEDRGLGVGAEIGRWIYAVVVYQILLSVVYGFVVGFIARKTLKWAESRRYIDKDNFFAYGLGLAFFVLGTTGLFGSDDILACFIAGNSFTWDDWFRLRTQEEEGDTFQDILDMLLNAAVFIYIGAIIPWGDYNSTDELLGLDVWRVIVLAIAVLCLRRPPFLMALYKVVPALTTFSEGAFTAWFGPIGVSAVFYIQVALRDIADDGTRDRVRAVYPPLVLFVVFASVLAHGCTIPVAKLGPTIVRRTATFTNTRSITFSSRPPSRPASIAPGEKIPVNPILAAFDGLAHILFFWRSDSFWRKETPMEKAFRDGKLAISAPGHIVRQPVIPDRNPEGVSGEESDSSGPSTGDAEAKKMSGAGAAAEEGLEEEVIAKDHDLVNPKPDVSVSREGSSSPTQQHERIPMGGGIVEQPALAALRGEVQRPVAVQRTHSGGILHRVHRAWGEEVEREREEAEREHNEGWPAVVRNALMSQTQGAGAQGDASAAGSKEGTRPTTPRPGTGNGPPAATGGIMTSGVEDPSVPGTPGGSRVRFHRHQ